MSDWERATVRAPKECDHNWEPAGMVFETQLLDEHGRVRLRQPDIDEGRCYFICRHCACHTYMATQWIGYRLHGSDDARGEYASAHHRSAWTVEAEGEAEE